MNPLAPFLERLRALFHPTPSGAVGLVDDLLELCREGNLGLSFRDGHCHVLAADQALEIPLPKSVFRALLARVAVLCNERIPNSVTPYGGEGELVVSSNPPAAYHVSFTNTPAEQRLELTYLGESRRDANRFIVVPSAGFGADTSHRVEPS